uniref:Uncharacterized protein n=1 Tax=Anguilla anguilla TaxID=7936 RepID=A0A0E9SAH7_ANGAN
MNVRCTEKGNSLKWYIDDNQG